MAQAHKDYSHVPLTRKLGIKQGSTVLLAGAPEGFVDGTLGPLPPGAELVETGEAPVDVAVLFVTEEQVLNDTFPAMSRAMAKAGGLWVAWPKKASRIPSDLDFDSVQSVGLAAGRVDNKSCAIDGDWQALRFVLRSADR